MPRTSSPTQDEVYRLSKLVGDLILLKKKPVRQIERELGMAQGTLNRILTGKIHLKLVHLFDILTTLDIPFPTFFSVAYTPEVVQEPTGSAVLTQLHRLAAARSTPTSQYLRAEIRDLLVELLEELGVATEREEGAPRRS